MDGAFGVMPTNTSPNPEATSFSSSSFADFHFVQACDLLWVEFLINCEAYVNVYLFVCI